MSNKGKEAMQVRVASQAHKEIGVKGEAFVLESTLRLMLDLESKTVGFESAVSKWGDRYGLAPQFYRDAGDGRRYWRCILPKS